MLKIKYEKNNIDFYAGKKISFDNNCSIKSIMIYISYFSKILLPNTNLNKITICSSISSNNLFGFLFDLENVIFSVKKNKNSRKI